MHTYDFQEEKYATLDEVIHDIERQDYEQSIFVAKKNLKCLKCEKNLKGEEYYHQFSYPYINVKLWKLCEECFNEIKTNTQKQK